MARVKGAMMTRKRRKKILKRAKGYWGAKSTHYRVANQAVMKSLKYAYIGRKHKKRDFRRLWITRISAAAKSCGMNYSRFMNSRKPASTSTVRCSRTLRSTTRLRSPRWRKRRRRRFDPQRVGRLCGNRLLFVKKAVLRPFSFLAAARLRRGTVRRVEKIVTFV